MDGLTTADWWIIGGAFLALCFLVNAFKSVGRTIVGDDREPTDKQMRYIEDLRDQILSEMSDAEIDKYEDADFYLFETPGSVEEASEMIDGLIPLAKKVGRNRD